MQAVAEYSRPEQIIVGYHRLLQATAGLQQLCAENIPSLPALPPLQLSAGSAQCYISLPQSATDGTGFADVG